MARFAAMDLSSSSTAGTGEAAPRHRLVVIGLALAAVVRLAHWWSVRNLPFVGQLVMDSEEYDRWARELAAGNWLGSESFFQAPLYPYWVGSLYALAGPRPEVVYWAQIVVAVAGLWALGRAARRLDGPRLEVAVVFLGALCGPLVFHDVQLLKESLAASVVAFLVLVLVRVRESPSLSGWLGAGALLGLLVGLRENALLLAPLVGVIAWSDRPRSCGSRGAVGAFWGRVGAFLGGLVLLLSPFAIRNWIVEGELLVTTYQGGVNFYIGNNPEADGTYRPLTPGRQVPRLEREEPVRLAEAAVGHDLSPGEVSRYWLDRSLEWARREPLAFLRLQLRKLRLFWSFYEWPDAVDSYWVEERSLPLRLAFVELGGLVLLGLAGLWLVRGRPGRWLPVFLLIFGWTLATVIFFVFSRYRLPMVPALILLAGVPLSRIWRAWDEAPRAGAVLGAIAVCAALAVPHVLGYAPRRDLVEYNLALLAEDRGEPDRAAAHYRAALEENPRHALSLMNLGTLEARRGDLSGAAELFRRAVAIEPNLSEAWTNLGAALLARGRVEAAAEALGRAVELDPGNVRALQNLSLVRAAQGRIEEAVRLNRRVLELAPGMPEAERFRERLHGDPEQSPEPDGERSERRRKR